MVALQAPTMPRSPRWVSVVVDTRSSMGAVAIERAQASLVALASSLDQGDHVDLLTTDPSSEPVAFDVDQAGAPALKKLAAALFAGKDEGNLADALTRAYDVAHATPAPANASRRLFMISNGPDDPSTLPTAAIQGNAQQGLLLVSVGTGPALQHGDRTLRAAAKAGRGHYLYVDSAAEAQRVFDQQAGEIFGIAFEDVQLEVQVPWYFELLTDESEVTNTASFDEVDPQNLAAGGHSTLLFKLEACDDSVLAQGDDLSVTVSWRDPSAVERVNHTVATTVPKAMADTTQLDAALAVFSYAEALKTLDSRRLQEALTLTNAGLAKQPGDAHLTEIAALIAKHPALELP